MPVVSASRSAAYWHLPTVPAVDDLPAATVLDAYALPSTFPSAYAEEHTDQDSRHAQCLRWPLHAQEPSRLLCAAISCAALVTVLPEAAVKISAAAAQCLWSSAARTLIKAF